MGLRLGLAAVRDKRPLRGRGPLKGPALGHLLGKAGIQAERKNGHRALREGRAPSRAGTGVHDRGAWEAGQAPPCCPGWTGLDAT